MSHNELGRVFLSDIFYKDLKQNLRDTLYNTLEFRYQQRDMYQSDV